MGYTLIHLYRNQKRPPEKAIDRNVLCLNGSAHIKKTHNPSEVTCEKCLELMEKKK